MYLIDLNFIFNYFTYNYFNIIFNIINVYNSFFYEFLIFNFDLFYLNYIKLSNYYIYLYVLIDEEESFVEVYKRRKYWVFITPMYNKKNYWKKGKKISLSSYFNPILYKLYLNHKNNIELNLNYIKNLYNADNNLEQSEQSEQSEQLERLEFLDNLEENDICLKPFKKFSYKPNQTINLEPYKFCPNFLLDDLFKQTHKAIKLIKLEKTFIENFYYLNNERKSIFLKKIYLYRLKLNFRELILKIHIKKLTNIVYDLNFKLKSFFYLDKKWSIDDEIIDDFDEASFRDKYIIKIIAHKNIFILFQNIFNQKFKIKQHTILLITNLIFLKNISFVFNNIYITFLNSFFIKIFIKIFDNFLISNLNLKLMYLNSILTKTILYFNFKELTICFLESETINLIFLNENISTNLINIKHKIKIKIKNFLKLDLFLFSEIFIKPQIHVKFILPFFQNKYKNWFHKFINKIINFFSNIKFVFIRNILNIWKKNKQNLKKFIQLFLKILTNKFNLYINTHIHVIYISNFFIFKIIKFINMKLNLNNFIITNYLIKYNIMFIMKFRLIKYFFIKNYRYIWYTVLPGINFFLILFADLFKNYFIFYFKKLHIIFLFNYSAMLYIYMTRGSFFLYYIISPLSIIFNIWYNIYDFYLFIYFETINNFMLFKLQINHLKFYFNKIRLNLNFQISEFYIDLLIESFFFIYDLDESYIFLRYLRPILLFTLKFIRWTKVLRNYFFYYLQINLWNFTFKQPEYSWTLEPYILRHKKIKDFYLTVTEGDSVNISFFKNYRGIMLFRRLFKYFNLADINSLYFDFFIIYSTKNYFKKSNFFFNNKFFYKNIVLNYINKYKFFSYTAFNFYSINYMHTLIYRKIFKLRYSKKINFYYFLKKK